MPQEFKKDPQAILDYTIDWSNWLDDDTIVAIQWIVPSGLTSVATSNTQTVATIWLSGGTAGTAYGVICRMTSTAGRRDDRTITLYVQER